MKVYAIVAIDQQVTEKHQSGNHPQERHGWRFGSVPLSSLRRQRASQGGEEWDEYKRRVRGGERRPQAQKPATGGSFEDFGQEKIENLEEHEVYDDDAQSPQGKAYHAAVERMHNQMVADYAGWAGSLSADEVSGVMDYTGAGYGRINRSLRGFYQLSSGMQSARDTAANIESLDSALMKGSLPRDTMFYRGMINTDMVKRFKEMEPGQVWSDPAYLSTSGAKHSWYAFTQGGNYGADRVSMRIRAPKGSRGGYLESTIVEDIMEYEFLLPRGSAFQINSIKEGNNGGVEVDLTLLPYNGPPPLPETARLKHADHDQSTHGRRGLSAQGQKLVDKPDDDFRVIQNKKSPMAREYRDWVNGLSDEERRAIKDYTGIHYGAINKTLRGQSLPENYSRDIFGSADDIQKKAEVINGALMRGRLKKDTQFIRGVTPTPEMRAMFKEGSVFTDNGFTSSSTDPDFKWGVGFDKDAKHYSVMELVIRAPKGSQGAYVGGINPRKNEREFLFPSGSSFYVNKITETMEPGRYEDSWGTLKTRITLTLLPPDTSTLKHADHDQSTHGRRGWSVQEFGAQRFEELKNAPARNTKGVYFDDRNEHWEVQRDWEKAGLKGEYTEFLADAYHGFEHGGLKSRVVEVSGDMVEGWIVDGDGKTVGTFTREIDIDRQAVIHDGFKINSAYRNTGFGRAFTENAERAYVRAGIKSVELEANADVGGYAWARMGFGFSPKNPEYRNTLLTDLTRTYGERYIDNFSGGRFAENFMQVYGELDADLPQAWDMAAFEGPDGFRIGRSVMLGSGWRGVKTLSPDSEGFAIGQQYYDLGRGQ